MQLLLETMVAADDGSPHIVLRLEGAACQMTPEGAREHARAVLEAAEAAEQDAFMVVWLREKVGMDLESAAAVLGEMRVARGRWRDQEGGGDAHA